MPIRIYDRPDVVVQKPIWYTPIIGTPPANYTAAATVEKTSGFYMGDNTTLFYTVKESGHLLPYNYYIRFDYKEKSELGTYYGTYKYPLSGTTTRSYRYNTNLYQIMVGSCSTKESALDVASAMMAGVNVAAIQQRAFSRLASDFDLLTTLAEAHKTVRMLLEARRFARDLIEDCLRGGRGTASAAARAKLAWKYGWQQLVRDIDNVKDFLNQPTKRKILSEVYRFDTVSETVTDFTSVTGNYYCDYDKTTFHKRTLSGHVRVAAEFEVNSKNLLFSPFITGWELLPYSFVVDWFVTVGDTLKTWDVLALARRTTSSLGLLFEEVSWTENSNIRKGTGTYAVAPYNMSGLCSATSLLKLRIPLGKPSFVPQLDVRLTSDRIIDAAALLRVRFA